MSYDESSGRNGGGFLIGFIAGSMIGAGLALLFAPKPGDQTRREVAEQAQRVAHAELALGDALVMVGTAGIGREPFRSEVKPGGTLLYIAIDEIEALYARAREAGADVAMEISDTDYGSRDFALRDPEGNLWSFGTYAPA